MQEKKHLGNLWKGWKSHDIHINTTQNNSARELLPMPQTQQSITLLYQGSEVPCATTRSKARPHSLDIHKQSLCPYLCLSTPMELMTTLWNVQWQKPARMAKPAPNRTKGSNRKLASVSIPPRDSLRESSTWEFWFSSPSLGEGDMRRRLTWMVSLAYHDQPWCTLQGPGDSKKSWTLRDL